ncbi:sulfatase-like hydrolase/transferase [Fulvivirgaceae bacterium PWU5]|uniref:Sulfatase-like hydrolase/transferase n=1 Tax=Dawidia cretensis TaxID=2782350 RepID=A0AAP2E187_9BACT|nr:sulfatase-like hydrolase/transferase [Dawidia cretensis]
MAFPSIATLMKAIGYETALIGKWHLGARSQHSPGKNGFDFSSVFTAVQSIIYHTKVPADCQTFMKMRYLSVMVLV